MEHLVENPNCTSATVDKNRFPNTISFDTAKPLIQQWVDFFYEHLSVPYFNDQIFRGFFLPIADINALAAIPDTIGVRAYICMDTNAAGNSSLRIIAVPVKNDPNFPVEGNTGIDQLCSEGVPNNSTIFDFTRPCPEQCDQSSNFYTIFPSVSEVTESSNA
jgi:hypothetical protein